MKKCIRRHFRSYQEWWRDRPDETRQPATAARSCGANSCRIRSWEMRVDARSQLLPTVGGGFFCFWKGAARLVTRRPVQRRSILVDIGISDGRSPGQNLRSNFGRHTGQHSRQGPGCAGRMRNGRDHGSRHRRRAKLRGTATWTSRKWCGTRSRISATTEPSTGLTPTRAESSWPWTNSRPIS